MRGRDAKAYRRVEEAVELPMLVLALVFGAVLLWPLIATPGATTQTVLEATMWLIWAAFVVEYVVLLFLAPDRGRFLRTHVLDLVVIVVPFLRPLRALRLLRLAAVWGRAGVAVKRISSRPGFRAFLLVVLVLIVSGAGLTFAFERDQPDTTFSTFADALWWAFVTATTVGYGDVYPTSNEGRAVALVLMLIGIGLFSVVTANIAAFFVETDDEQRDGDEGNVTALRHRLEHMEQLLEALAADRGLNVPRQSADNTAPHGASQPVSDAVSRHDHVTDRTS